MLLHQKITLVIANLTYTFMIYQTVVPSFECFVAFPFNLLICELIVLFLSEEDENEEFEDMLNSMRDVLVSTGKIGIPRLLLHKIDLQDFMIQGNCILPTTANVMTH